MVSLSALVSDIGTSDAVGEIAGDLSCTTSSVLSSVPRTSTRTPPPINIVTPELIQSFISETVKENSDSIMQGLKLAFMMVTDLLEQQKYLEKYCVASKNIR